VGGQVVAVVELFAAQLAHQFAADSYAADVLAHVARYGTARRKFFATHVALQSRRLLGGEVLQEGRLFRLLEHRLRHHGPCLALLSLKTAMF